MLVWKPSLGTERNNVDLQFVKLRKNSPWDRKREVWNLIPQSRGGPETPTESETRCMIQAGNAHGPLWVSGMHNKGAIFLEA